MAAVWDNTAKIKEWKEDRMCPLGRAVICEEGRIPHCIIHPHLTRHGRRHPLGSAGHWNPWRRSVSNCIMCSVSAFGCGTVSSSLPYEEHPYFGIVT
jgi:hypothetical protein